jgi:hypothetical protein
MFVLRPTSDCELGTTGRRSVRVGLITAVGGNLGIGPSDDVFDATLAGFRGSGGSRCTPRVREAAARFALPLPPFPLSESRGALGDDDFPARPRSDLRLLRGRCNVLGGAELVRLGKDLRLKNHDDCGCGC